MKVCFEGIEVDVCNSGSTTFTDFEKWVRNRFNIEETDKLLYKNKAGAEIIPCTCGDSRMADVYNLVSIERVQSPICIDGNKHSGSNSNALWALFVVMVPPFLVMVVALTLAWNKHSSRSYGPAESLHVALTMLGLGIWQDRLVEAYVAFLTWSFTYLFIRRLANPESTAGAFNKYAADSIFGGLAASAAILMKHALNASLLKR
eukprot:gene13456-28521_t